MPYKDKDYAARQRAARRRLEKARQLADSMFPRLPAEAVGLKPILEGARRWAMAEAARGETPEEEWVRATRLGIRAQSERSGATFQLRPAEPERSGSALVLTAILNHLTWAAMMDPTWRARAIQNLAGRVLRPDGGDDSEVIAAGVYYVELPAHYNVATQEFEFEQPTLVEMDSDWRAQALEDLKDFPELRRAGDERLEDPFWQVAPWYLEWVENRLVHEAIHQLAPAVVWVGTLEAEHQIWGRRQQGQEGEQPTVIAADMPGLQLYLWPMTIREVDDQAFWPIGISLDAASPLGDLRRATWRVDTPPVD